MISAATAKEIVKAHQLSTISVELPLQQALQLRLSEAVYSTVDVPSFIQSSMDGYAFKYADWQPGKQLAIRGEMQAGTKNGLRLQPGEAARIFTGAPLPEGADTVVMQEKAKTAKGQLLIEDHTLKPAANARPVGSAIRAGELALEKNCVLTAGAIGFLAGMGITHVQVYKRPAVGIIITGDELAPPGKALNFGEVYESNSAALKAALLQSQVDRINVYSAADEPLMVQQVLQKALQENDMVLLTGGVSVGDYDFVIQAAAACGIQQLFHKIKQRPGKPLYFGRKESRLVFGLPGNPSSVLSCFYEYVLLALQAALPVLRAPLAQPLQKAAGLTHFLKAWYDGVSVHALDAQESYRMSSFAKANCLLQLDETTTACAAGELVEVHLLPF